MKAGHIPLSTAFMKNILPLCTQKSVFIAYFKTHILDLAPFYLEGDELSLFEFPKLTLNILILELMVPSKNVLLCVFSS